MSTLAKRARCPRQGELPREGGTRKTRGKGKAKEGGIGREGSPDWGLKTQDVIYLQAVGSRGVLEQGQAPFLTALALSLSAPGAWW